MQIEVIEAKESLRIMYLQQSLYKRRVVSVSLSSTNISKQQKWHFERSVPAVSVFSRLLAYAEKAQRVQSACFVAGNFCQYWNLNSQISNDFDILIMVSNAKFKKKLNGQSRFT